MSADNRALVESSDEDGAEAGDVFDLPPSLTALRAEVAALRAEVVELRQALSRARPLVHQAEHGEQCASHTASECDVGVTGLINRLLAKPSPRQRARPPAVVEVRCSWCGRPMERTRSEVVRRARREADPRYLCSPTCVSEFNRAKAADPASVERLEKIVRRHAEGATYAQLAREFGISSNRVYQLILRAQKRAGWGTPQPAARGKSRAQ